MNDPAAEDRTDNGETTGRSRIEREVDEILTRSAGDLPSEPKRRPRLEPVAQRRRAAGTAVPDWASVWRSRLAASPVLLALGAAICAVLIADSSQLIANILAFLAVVLVVVPIVQRFRAPATQSDAKVWRGQVIDPRSNLSSPMTELRRWWASRRR